ncbi:Gfo/Idh/MocA family protein [Arcicella lustrica]|uniref:Gfo/Idh/MocA family oxidoreductase n=1 Tax=Arcicella lustrica TaxID=2984196 RepID=A0ABU5SL04_9BACT|nr:Gfo/Idh/MocA family oxidoreductase [Arcicella sp. DC25W]MEA5427985.1 Gfo/Idh/MocA family oxidoreductase [Arcicella sp. DC25W]
MENSRRKFLKNMGGSVAAISIGTTGVNAHEEVLHRKQIPTTKISANDKIRIGLIGAGIIGHYDTDAALKVDGVELLAVCDLYTGRLDRAKEKWGNGIFTTKDYREILARKDIDAVLICTPDHWHQKMAIDAMNAGKHVYCEKPMIQKIEDGHAIIETQKKTGKVFLVGSQRASSLAVLEAKKHFEKGVIGELSYVEAYCDRTDAKGAWQYSIPTDASPETIDFDKFLGNAPKVPFSAERFFRWRNFKDYGTGSAGDLVVHLLTGLHTITGSIGPNKIFALGEVNYWKDGRDAYDLINSFMAYPQTPTLSSFQLYTRINLASGEGKNGFGIKLIGTEGSIEVGWNDFKVRTLKRSAAPGFGGYDSFDSFSAQQKEDYKKWYKEKYGNTMGGFDMGKTIEFTAPANYDDRVDHMICFFNGIRSNTPVLEDATFGLRTAGPSIACNISAEKNKALNWDAEKMKLS